MWVMMIQVSWAVCALMVIYNTEGYVFQSKGKISPADAILYDGENLTMTCRSLLPEKPDSVELEVYQHEAQNATPPTLVQYYNESEATATAYLYVDHQTSRRLSLLCYAAPKSSNRTLIHSVFVYVNTPPKHVELTEIRKFPDNYTMSFSWNLTDVKGLNVAVDWNPNSIPNLQGNACSERATHNQCVTMWSGQDIVGIRVNITKKKGSKRPTPAQLSGRVYPDTPKVFEWFAHVIDNIQLAAPTDVYVVNITNTCITVNWIGSTGYYAYHSDTTLGAYSLEATNPQTGERFIATNTTARTQPSVGIICGLKPNIQYQLRLRVRVDSSKYHWSDYADWSVNADRTLLNVSTAADDISTSVTSGKFNYRLTWWGRLFYKESWSS